MSEQVIFVGCDDGYAVTKLSWRVDNQGPLQSFSCPSRVGVGATLTDVNGRASDRAYITNGRNYIVLPGRDAIDTRFDDYPISDANRVLVHHALRKAGLWGKSISICTGLPPGTYFRSGTGVNDALVKAKQASLRKPVRTLGADAPVKIVDSLVCPEAVAAVFDFAIDDEGGIVHEIGDGGWGVVDIGGRTTDVVTAVWDDAIMIDHARTGTMETGALKARDHVVLRFCADHDVNAADVGGQDSVLETRVLKIYGREHDVGRYVDAAIDMVGEEILRYVQKVLGTGARMDKVLFVGGGAEVFRRVIEAYPSAAIPEAPAFANARGMLRFAQFQAAEAT